MKPRHVEGAQANARAILASLTINVGQGWHTLKREQVEALYETLLREPHLGHINKNVRAARGRYYFEMLQRRASGRVA